MLTRTILTATVLTSVLMLNAPTTTYAARKGIANVARGGRSLGSNGISNGFKGNVLSNRNGTFRSNLGNGNGSNNLLSNNKGLGNRLNVVRSGNGLGNGNGGFTGVGSNTVGTRIANNNAVNNVVRPKIGNGFTGVGSNPSGGFSGIGSNPKGGFSGVGSNPTAGIPTGKNTGNGNGHHNFGHHNFGHGHHGFGFGHHGFGFGHGAFPHHFGFGKGLFVAGLALAAANGQATFTGPLGLTQVSAGGGSPNVAVDLTPLVWSLSPSGLGVY